MNNFSKFIAIVSTLALLGQGCARPPVAVDGTPSAPRSECENAYFPMRPGSSITYRISGSGSDSQYEAKFLDASGGMNRVQYIFSVDGESLTLDQEYTCANGVLSSRGYADFSSILGGTGFRYETESVEGVFLPANLAVGSEWETTYRIIIRTDHPQFKALMDGKRQMLRMKNRIVGSERVTVPAGTYEALKMESETSIESELGFNSDFTNTSWLVRDVGLVKSSGGVEGYVSETEAIEIN
ncbi:MAG: hypothetical protein AAB668_01935 [Patescibacteria group bacterium]